MEIPSVQHAALHRVLNVLPLELELLQSCVQVLEAQTRQPERNVQSWKQISVSRFCLYQQLLGRKSARYGPFVAILLSEVVDQLDDLLLQVSLDGNLF